MGHLDSIYRLEDIIEMDDAFVGGKRPGKRGRGAQGKKPTVVAVERRGKKAGFMAAKVVDTILTLNGTFHGVTHKNLQEYVSEF